MGIERNLLHLMPNCYKYLHLCVIFHKNHVNLILHFAFLPLLKIAITLKYTFKTRRIQALEAAITQ